MCSKSNLCPQRPPDLAEWQVRHRGYLTMVCMIATEISQGQNYFHNNSKSLFALFTVLTLHWWFKAVVSKTAGALAGVKALAPNFTKISHCILHSHPLTFFFLKHIVTLKNVLDDGIKILLNLHPHFLIFCMTKREVCTIGFWLHMMTA